MAPARFVVSCAALWAVMVLVGACHLIFPFDPGSDASASRDARSTDGSSSSEKGGVKDGALPITDGPHWDTRLDDLEPKPDAPPMDLLPADGSAPALDQSTVAACAKGASVAYVWPGGAMAICRSDSGAKSDQCGASVLCGGGWHLCTASEYLTNGGALGAPGGGAAWIAGCTKRSGSGYTALTDGICSCKGGAAGSQSPVAYPCKTTPTGNVGSVAPQIGISQFINCYRIGDKVTGKDGHWYPASATYAGYNGAVCCS